MSDAKRTELLEIHGHLKVGDEEWEGVGWWTLPAGPDSWPQLSADIAAAFTAAAVSLLLGTTGKVTFRATGKRTTCYPSAERSMARYLNYRGLADPSRVFWNPIIQVRISLGGEGVDHG